tara:strand:+ start:84517 stop:86490 length:1974 start_codon:yes stop_codon:yes gene_type:complete
MSDDKKPSIFKKAIQAGEAYFDSITRQAEADIIEKANSGTSGNNDSSDFVYGKSIVDEPSYRINSQGFKEKPHRVLNSHLKQMAYKDSVVAAVIQTRQNQVSNHSRLVKSEQERGFIIKLKDEEEFLRKIKEKLEVEMRAQGKDQEMSNDENDSQVTNAKNVDEQIEKAMGDESDAASEQDQGAESSSDDEKSDDAVEEFNWELDRKAREKLEEEIRDRRSKVENFVKHCGEMEDRPFETKKWTFDSFLRAITRDTLTYDFIATEIVPTQANDPHHFYPVDAGTIKFASPSLKAYKAFPGSQTNVDLLYPEKQLEALEEKDAFELDEQLLEDELYKYVQVVRGRIERGYTEDEMKIGMRNISTDLYNNGYGVAELELLVGLVSSHLNTEYYNQSYFTQGFSAKGILHLKASIPRRKLETIRQQWHHMIKGTRNSFQTPIFAGMDEVNWIPLTQNHSDIEFAGWMNYLIKMICAIYQIDPYEIGIGMKDEGKSGGMGGDNTSEKIDQSKDKGLYPLLRFLSNYINTNIIDMIDSDFELVFTGVSAESQSEALERQEKEVKFKKTVNEIRAEDNLPPLPGMDNLILDNVYMQWYGQFSKEAKDLAQENQANEEISGAEGGPAEEEGMYDDAQLDDLLNAPPGDEDMEKSISIEYYTLNK